MQKLRRSRGFAPWWARHWQAAVGDSFGRCSAASGRASCLRQRGHEQQDVAAWNMSAPNVVSGGEQLQNRRLHGARPAGVAVLCSQIVLGSCMKFQPHGRHELTSLHGTKARQCADGPPAATQVTARICSDLKRVKPQHPLTILPIGRRIIEQRS